MISGTTSRVSALARALRIRIPISISEGWLSGCPRKNRWLVSDVKEGPEAQPLYRLIRLLQLNPSSRSGPICAIPKSRTRA
ncbi:hypothetical protein BJV74DRAFT_804309 [Russula compacta]|nr:hypothetical protein BJV74DRAFT_804309 [Russula compacta]